nr:hypothetical protein [Tanacetum cinerariifolium]
MYNLTDINDQINRVTDGELAKEASPVISAKVTNMSQHVQEEDLSKSGRIDGATGGSVLGVLEEVIRVGQVMGTMMTCHPLIRPAATCTVPRTQLLAAIRRHVAASYWIVASDVAPTSAPPATGQRRRFTVVTVLPLIRWASMILHNWYQEPGAHDV